MHGNMEVKKTQYCLCTAVDIVLISCLLVCNEDLPHSLLFRDFKHLGSLDHVLDDSLFRLVQCWVLTSTERLQLLRLHRPPSFQPTQKHIYPLMKQRSFKDTRALIGLGFQYDFSLARQRRTIWCYVVRDGGTILVTPALSLLLDKRLVRIKVLGKSYFEYIHRLNGNFLTELRQAMTLRSSANGQWVFEANKHVLYRII
jgi:hypothetical protein